MRFLEKKNTIQKIKGMTHLNKAVNSTCNLKKCGHNRNNKTKKLEITDRI